MRRTCSFIARPALPVVLALVVFGCGSDPLPASVASTTDTVDPGSDSVTGKTDTATPLDLGIVGLDSVPLDEGPEQPIEVFLPDDAAPGSFGAPCTDNGDCEDGFCVPGPLGSYVCSRLCIDDCPGGWFCKGVVQTEPDIAFICLVGTVELCAVCTVDEDCGGKLDRCQTIGNDGGKYCTQHCVDNEDCAVGYSCSAPLDGVGSSQCVPDTNSCICTSELNNTSRVCQQKNTFGTCNGLELCEGPDGWVGCDASVPAPEACNGIDDDCDGTSDEDFAPTPCLRETAFGKCAGVETCQGVGGSVCDASIPGPEICDGEDNDCNGHTDDDYADADGDGLGDCIDPDDDDDTVPDVVDNCPFDLNFQQGDQDSDDIGDACDSDRDGDGVANVADLCPADFDPLQADADQDGKGDACDEDRDGDGDGNTTDCDADDPLISKSAVEACDGVDNDCDDLLDEGFIDTDSDKLANCIDPDDDNDGDGDVTDCAPENPLIATNKKEACDTLDNDCDGYTDEDFGDVDKNGILDCIQVDGDGDGDPDGVDCAPLNNQIKHGATEVCDGIDNDCDGFRDEDFPNADGDTVRDCVDADDDNDGDPDETDCKPVDKTVSSLVQEACNGKDDDCDDDVDEGYPNLDQDGVADCKDVDDDGDDLDDDEDNCPLVANTTQIDSDGDESGDACDDDDDNDGVDDGEDNCQLAGNSGQADLDEDGIGDACDSDDDADGSPDVEDCRPKNADILPGATELCDGLDQNCSGVADEGFTDTDGDLTADCVDSDDDNDGDPDVSDCEPTSAAKSNKALESCNGVDDNCNAVVDEGFVDGEGDGTANCVDLDDDNDGDPDLTDCDPGNASVHTGATETCNGKDDNCTSGADEGFVDSDGDGARDCVDPDDDNDGDPDATDCAPTKASISSTVSEVCDGADNDCDQSVDEGFPDTDLDGKADCLDADDDGDGDPDVSDCAPQNALVSKSAIEACDGKDNDCDGALDEGFPNPDGDGIASCVDADDDNDGDPDETDCAPNEPAISSLVTESCDGKDNNCSGSADEVFPDSDQDGDADCVDTDDDNDGRLDTADNCPMLSNPSQADGDSDGQGDPCDADQDNDGISNAIDNCVSLANGTQVDLDKDGQGDACDADDDGDGTADADDCAPLNGAIHPGAAEKCDQLDNDCDIAVDEGFGDTDGDGVGDCLDGDDDGDDDPDQFDCAPLDDAVSHTAAEVCDGVDQNCDGLLDEGFPDFDTDGLANCIDDDDDGDGVPDGVDNCPIAKNTDQADPDGDAKGNPCDTDDDGDGTADAQDCAPLNASIAPTKAEVCDGVDNNCKQGIDEAFSDLDVDGQADCVDADDDGDGDQDNIDCSPGNKLVSSKATESCDGVDNNCSGQIDEGFADADGDGTPDCRDLDDDNDGDADTNDCAPLDATIRHGASEVCNGKDDNCSGTTDEGYPDTDADTKKDCTDTDDDNDGDPDASDCAPLSALVSKLAVETCNAVDDNCSGTADEGFPNFDGDTSADCVDADDDSDGDLDTTDCAPRNVAISKNALEVCNGKDDDCDGSVDETFSNVDGDADADCVDLDDDNDGDGDATDCADNNPNVSSLVTEICDNLDNDCDGQVDESFSDSDADGLRDCFDTDDDNDGKADGVDNCPLIANDQTDTDADKLGDACDVDDDNDSRPDATDNCRTIVNAGQTDTDGDGAGNECDADDDGDGVADVNDCAPTNAAVFPGATEVCDATDNDCDTVVDEGSADTDADGLKDCVDPDDDNDLTGDSGDCAPLNALVHPAAVEICDGVDQNCNGTKDDGYPNVDGDGLADCVDLDDDGDTVPDTTDNCRVVQNTNQADTDNDKAGDACDGDDDNDDIADESDNCRTVVNASQTDTDGDGAGNACDPDDDNDGSLDAADCKSLDKLIFPGATEVCDGVDNACNGVPDAGFPDFDIDTVKDCVDPDDDNDGDPDSADCAPKDKTIYHGAAELCDGLDTNCNGAVDETFPNLDSDGQADCIDLDDDGDGIPDSTDNCPINGNGVQADVDEDGIGDACDPQVPGTVVTIVIRDAPKGQGQAVGTLTIQLGQALTVYAAGYDVNGLFAGGQAVTWSKDGTLDAPVAAANKKTAVFTPVTPVSSGRLIASPLQPGVVGDATGIITVTAPPAGAAVATKATIEPDRASLVADGADEATIRVVVRDQYGTPTTVGAPHVVVIQTTAGTLVGAVAYLGGGVYSQKLRSSTVIGTATLTASVGGTPTGGQATVAFVQPELVVSTTATIDCSNYNAFEGKSILVQSGILTIATADACPLMKFGTFIMKGGIVRHGKGARIDIEVDELFIGSGAQIDVSGEGPSIGTAAPPVIDTPFELFGDLINPRTSGRNNCPTYPGSFVTSPGGLVRIRVVGSGKATVDGAIRADGNSDCLLDAPYNGRGLRAGDSGGRIRLEGKSLGGVGVISARGRAAAGSDAARLVQTAGNGGVVALVGFGVRTGSFADDQLVQKVSVRPGIAFYNKGPNGALVLLPPGQTEPDVIFGAGADEGSGTQGSNSSAGLSVLGTVPRGMVTAIDAVSITIAGAEFAPGRYVGQRVNPNIAQGVATDLVEDTTFTVIANTTDRIFLNGNPTTASNVGKFASGVLVAENLDIRAQASVRTAGLVVVRHGDRSTGDDATFDIKGALVAEAVDLGTAESIRLSGDIVPIDFGGGQVLGPDASFSAKVLYRQGAPAFAFNILASAGASFLAHGPLVTNALTLSRGEIRAKGDVTVQGPLSIASTGGRSAIRLEGDDEGQQFTLASGSGIVNLGAVDLSMPVVDLGAATGFTIFNSGITSGRLHTASLERQGDAAFPFSMQLTGSELSGLETATASTVTLAANAEAAAKIIVGEVTCSGAFVATGSTSSMLLGDGFGALTAFSIDIGGGTHTVGTLASDTTVRLAGSTVTTGQIATGGNLTIDLGAFVTANELDVALDTFIAGTSTLTHPASTASQVFGLDITGKNLTVATGSNINVNRRGFAEGRTIGNTLSGGAVLGVGGSNGGLGGTGLSGGTAPLAYGLLLDPRLPGGGGGGLEANGGGQVRIALTGTLTVNGTIMANGKDISGGGGAGGSISISAVVVTGAGVGRIQALGGDALDGTSGGGAGGRIALLDAATFSGNFALASLVTNTDVGGGTGFVNGGAGTVFVRSQADAFGSLLISNQGTVAPSGSTPLPTLPGGSVTAKTSGSFTSSVSLAPAGAYAGYEVNPKTGQGAATLADDLIFTILNHTGSVVTTAQNGVGTVAVVGQPHRAMFRFKNVEITGGASVTTAGDILVQEGDVSGGGTSTFTVGAGSSLSANVLDLTVVPAAGVSGTITATTLLCTGCP